MDPSRRPPTDPPKPKLESREMKPAAGLGPAAAGRSSSPGSTSRAGRGRGSRPGISAPAARLPGCPPPAAARLRAECRGGGSAGGAGGPTARRDRLQARPGGGPSLLPLPLGMPSRNGAGCCLRCPARRGGGARRAVGGGRWRTWPGARSGPPPRARPGPGRRLPGPAPKLSRRRNCVGSPHGLGEAGPVRNDELTALPTELAALTGLAGLGLYANQPTGVPPEFRTSTRQAVACGSTIRASPAAESAWSDRLLAFGIGRG